MLIDRFNRKITNLRISVTDRCNLRCFYCHKEGFLSKKCDELTPDEISKIAQVFKDLGIKKVKITGGEPLVRQDIVEIIAEMPEFDEISMTTNGILLEKYAMDLKKSGLNRVNVSLDSLNPEKYRDLSRGKLEDVLRGLEAAVEAELTPVKLNMVVMKGINENEVNDMIHFISKYNKDGLNVILQLIELLKLPGLESYWFDIGIIENRISAIAKDVRVRKMQKRKQYLIDEGAIEFVRPTDNTEFCYNCNRIRVTCDGKVKPCLLRNDNLVDVRGLEGEELRQRILEAVNLRKPYFREKIEVESRIKNCAVNGAVNSTVSGTIRGTVRGDLLERSGN
jgi:cyclic pyranopterin phosphate synthase